MRVRAPLPILKMHFAALVNRSECNVSSAENDVVAGRLAAALAQLAREHAVGRYAMPICAAGEQTVFRAMRRAASVNSGNPAVGQRAALAVAATRRIVARVSHAVRIAGVARRAKFEVSERSTGTRRAASPGPRTTTARSLTSFGIDRE